TGLSLPGRQPPRGGWTHPHPRLGPPQHLERALPPLGRIGERARGASCVVHKQALRHVDHLLSRTVESTADIRTVVLVNVARGAAVNPARRRLEPSRSPAAAGYGGGISPST